MNLTTASLEIIGYLTDASNATLLVHLDGDERQAAIYKPQRGERPLWDFPGGTLCHREVAAYELDALLGWGLVPQTTLRDGPAGIGSVQRYIDHDPEPDLNDCLQRDPEAFAKLALFDVIANNADRKGGHCLIDRDGKLWGIDHGLCFHVEYKLRTIVWVFAGDSVAEPLLRDVATARTKVEDVLSDVLGSDELDALLDRMDAVLTSGRYPEPVGDGPNVPWPPW